MKTVKRMMIQTEGDNYKLYGKTGQGSNVGWYVGFIETKELDYVFVTNISDTSADARNIMKDILQKYHLTSDWELSWCFPKCEDINPDFSQSDEV